MRSLFALALVALASCSSTETKKPPPCASTFAGTWTLTAQQRPNIDSTPKCPDYKKAYTFTITISSDARTWTESRDDGTEASYEIESVDCNGSSLKTKSHAQARDGTTYSSAHSVALDGDNLLGSFAYAEADSGTGATLCVATYTTTAQR